MALTAEQHSQLATAYEKAAADRMVPAQQQVAFARKAHWFRILARLAEKNEQAVHPKQKAPLAGGAEWTALVRGQRYV
jgi:hypothetical protein